MQLPFVLDTNAGPVRIGVAETTQGHPRLTLAAGGDLRYLTIAEAHQIAEALNFGASELAQRGGA